jgi:hypothetical protein
MGKQKEIEVRNAKYVDAMIGVPIIFSLLFLPSLIPISIFYPTLAVIILLCGILAMYVRLTGFRFDAEGMSFLSNHMRILDRTIAMRIPYSDIIWISLTDRSLFQIRYDPVKPKNFTIPSRIMRHQENEKAFRESLNRLKDWHLSHGHSDVILDPPEYFYSNKSDVRSLREKNGRVVYAVSGGKYSV